MPSPKPGERDLLVAVDIGGTFTDITLQDAATGEAWTAKTPSTPRDPSEAFLTGVGLALAEAGRSAGEIGRVLHGTTVATNLILEGKTAPTALLTTKGFRHVLEIGRADLPRRDNLWAWRKPKRPVPPALVFEIPGRIGADGAELAPLDEAAVRAAVTAAQAGGAQAIAICFLHSFANPAQERRALAIAREVAPGLALTASCDVLPVVREYERSMATVLNAAVMPAVATYVGRLEERLARGGIAAPLLLMRSNGGVAGAAAIRRAPVQTALSGPAAGVVGAAAMARAAGIPDIITVDIGGTSADICLIKGGQAGLTQSGRVGPWPLPLPMVDMVTIGAGGGSLARVAGGALTVGPESAGADPGPACYGRGCTRPTVTDAHLVLGHLPPSLLGGRMALDLARAEAAIAEHVAQPLGLTPEAAARGILAIADNTMVGAIRIVSVERGHDPRGFALVPFGGAGPLHGTALAELLGMNRVLVPPSPGVLCAQGLLAADLKAEFSRSVAQPLAGADPVGLEAGFAALEGEAAAWFAQEAVAEADRSTRRIALLRYEEQGFELAVPWPAAADPRPALAEGFAAAHRGLYGFDLPGIAIEIVTLRVEAAGRLPAPAMPAPRGGQGAEIGTQPLRRPEGAVQARILDRARLAAGKGFAGPAILTQLDATTLVPPGWHGRVLPAGAVLLERG
ncbi:hydantoinase/oxoprolinase family protein [Siccirubricoccus sp. KC 17139]|uniref:Hydantoinase/oxoprolinase family protein n=1 Tax=Siccirubricoccus soli TaxID=2899147 RepID=A0ABT1D521_9PROT|nr:hydantoinase/oxoprolinase family protein [Siccirubricoccus soli]MCO6417013.1 hydantoinase/oxoprolinase family protein [Siccirubricoccus soli]MCP2683148.1 hydantoinase/oxoprolinase family protein [Siccirubricoccus soli]